MRKASVILINAMKERVDVTSFSERVCHRLEADPRTVTLKCVPEQCCRKIKRVPVGSAGCAVIAGLK